MSGRFDHINTGGLLLIDINLDARNTGEMVEPVLKHNICINTITESHNQLEETLRLRAAYD